MGNLLKQIVVSNYILLLLALLSISSCAITHGTSVVVGGVKEPTNPEEIKLYTTPPIKYEEIAIIYAESAHESMSKQILANNAMARLKDEAAEVGANGILLESVGDIYVGSSGIVSVPSAAGSTTIIGALSRHTRPGKKASGMAIFVTEESSAAIQDYSDNPVTEENSAAIQDYSDNAVTEENSAAIQDYSDNAVTEENSTTIQNNSDNSVTEGTYAATRNYNNNSRRHCSSRSEHEVAQHPGRWYYDDGSDIVVFDFKISDSPCAQATPSINPIEFIANLFLDK